MTSFTFLPCVFFLFALFCFALIRWCLHTISFESSSISIIDNNNNRWIQKKVNANFSERTHTLSSVWRILMIFSYNSYLTWRKHWTRPEHYGFVWLNWCQYLNGISYCILLIWLSHLLDQSQICLSIGIDLCWCISWLFQKVLYHNQWIGESVYDFIERHIHRATNCNYL